jgi:intracellular septation protein
MSDAEKSQAANPDGAKETAKSAGQLLVDLGPIIVFVAAFNLLGGGKNPQAIFTATGLFIAATLAAIAFSWWRTKKIPPVLWVTGILVTVFGGLTILLHDENFMKIKPTFVYGFYAFAILGSLFVLKQNIWKLLLSHAFILPDKIWDILAVRWALFFVFMAGVNELIRNTQSTEFWVNSRLFIGFPLVFLFMLVNLPITLKHAGKTTMEDSAPK